MIHVYSSDMQGAPALSYASGSLVNVLDACLVTGFNLSPITTIEVAAGIATATVTAGHRLKPPVRIKISGHASLNGTYPAFSTPSPTTFTFPAAVPDGSYPGGSVSVSAAGWQKVFSATGTAVYRSLDTLSTQTLFRIEQSGWSGYVNAYETMSDINTGTGKFTALNADKGDTFYCTYPSTATTPRAWWVAATESLVVLWVARGFADASILSGIGGTLFGDVPPLFGYDLSAAFIPNESFTAAVSDAPLDTGAQQIIMRRGLNQDPGPVSGTLTTPFGRASVGTGLVMGAQTENRLLISEITAMDFNYSTTITPRGVLPYLYMCPLGFADSSYYPPGTTFAGAAGSAAEGKTFWCVPLGRNDSTPSSRKRAFVDVSELTQP